MSKITQSKVVPFFLILFFMSTLLPASDIIITATKYQTPRESSSSSIIVLDQDFIKKSKKNYVYELLQQLPNVQVNRSGPSGLTTVHLKGAESPHLLVILDGLIINDPINTSSLFDFNQLSLQNIKKIEILPGSQSVIYGSSAIGGVINIISKTSLEKNNLKLAYGSYQHLLASQSFSTKIKKTIINFGLSVEKSSGFNATSITQKNPAEKDGFQKENYILSIKNNTNKFAEITLNSRANIIRSDNDKGFSSERDDENFTSKDKFYFHSLKLRPKTNIDFIQPEVLIGISKAIRRGNNLPDDIGKTHDTYFYESELFQLKAHNVFYLKSERSLILGVDFLNEKGLFDLNISNIKTTFQERGETHIGAYAHYQTHLNKLLLNLGVRAEHHRSSFNTVFKIGPAYQFSPYELKIYSLLSTGFKAPTLYQLYSQYGNKELMAEKSTHFEVGLEKKIPYGQLHLSIFKSEIRNLIDLHGTYPNSRYGNIQKINIQGIDLSAQWEIINKLIHYKLAGQFLETRNLVTKKQLINRATLKTNQDLEFIHRSHNISFQHLFTSQRWGGSTFLPIKMPPHHLFNLNYSFQISDQSQASGQLNNIFDKNYEQNSGIQTGGRNWKLSYQYQF